MRHVISPSIAEGAFHYYEKISFQLFFITQEVYCVSWTITEASTLIGYSYHVINFMQRFRRVDQLPVDLDALKNGLSSLLLPSQKFSFSPHM